MICWSCEKSVGDADDAFCGGCGAVQPPAPDTDLFRIVGLARRYALDLGELERRYKDAAKRLHPDRFARGHVDVRARRASMARTVMLNAAWKTLRDPVRRAEYLLSLAGIEVGGEEGTMRRKDAAGAAGPGREKVPVPQELLLEVMELREELQDARSGGDEARVRALTEGVRARRTRAMDAVMAAFDADPQDIDRATAELVAVRYFDRFLDEAGAGPNALPPGGSAEPNTDHAH